MKKGEMRIEFPLSESDFKRSEKIAKSAGFNNVHEMSSALMGSFINYLYALETGDIEYLNSVPAELERIFEEARAELKKRDKNNFSDKAISVRVR